MIVMNSASLALVLTFISSSLVQSRYEMKGVIHQDKFKTFNGDDDDDYNYTVKLDVTDAIELGPKSTELESKFLILEKSFEKLETRPGKKFNSTSNSNHNNNNNHHHHNNNNRIGYYNVKVQKRRRNPKCIHAKCQCKTYKGKPITANCNGAFRVLPRFLELPAVLREVSMRGGNLTSIGPSAFKGFRTKKLDLRGNNFRHFKIDAMAFEGLEKSLTILTLSDCQLTEVPGEAISVLSNLKLLYLEGNNIPHIESKFFSNFKKLKELHLSENKITSLKATSFIGLKQLDVLVLSQNQLQFIEEKTFSYLNRLTHLDLSGNSLQTIHPDTFAGLANLKWLKLDSNFIRKLEKDFLRGLQKLRNLKLENNPIYWIDDETFTRVPKLSYLALDLSNLSHITFKTFEGLDKLKTLNLGDFPAVLNSLSKEEPHSENLVLYNGSSGNSSSFPSSEKGLNHSNFSPSSNGHRIFASASELERISLTDYEGHFGGLRIAMISEKVDFGNLNVFVVPMRQCSCSQDWVVEFTALGSYVHGFCLDGKPLSCTKDNAFVEDTDLGMNFISRRIINGETQDSHDDNRDDDDDDDGGKRRKDRREKDKSIYRRNRNEKT